jgi:hypothetical protein
MCLRNKQQEIMSTLVPLSELLERKSELLELKLWLMAIQIQRQIQKYREDQPRVPRGSPLGGQWTDDGNSEPVDVAGRYDARRAAVCTAQQMKDEELCRGAKGALCWSIAKERYAACTRNDYLPMLYF